MKKLPSEINEKDALLLWLSLFRAETEEELEQIKGMGVPMMDKAISAYYTITASSEFREIERLREKARHDEAQALYHAKLEGRLEGRQEGISERNTEIARNLIKLGMPPNQITAATGLSAEDIEKLCRNI